MRIVALVSLILPVVSTAQGTIGGQGFGYPAGQFSARAMGTGGALGPFDQISPVNPAAIASTSLAEAQLRPARMLFAHLEPEFRSTENGAFSSSTRLSRFPLAGAVSRLGRRGTIGLTFSTYLDRTWETSSTSPQSINGDDVDITTRYASEGSVSDLRAAMAWLIGSHLQAGIGYHAYTGENRLAIGWDFPDSTPFGDVSQQLRLTYSGRGASAGAIYNVPSQGAVSVYGRWGGGVKLRANDTVVATADMPNHVGVALKYTGLRGSTFAAGWESVEWSAMESLGSADLRVRDTRRISFGLETTGPGNGKTSATFLRLGAYQRTLPFDALGSETKETAFSIGTGLAFTRSNFDLALIRANRSAGAGRERAWLLSLGIAITP
jgi:hypothetical protein